MLCVTNITNPFALAIKNQHNAGVRHEHYRSLVLKKSFPTTPRAPRSDFFSPSYDFSKSVHHFGEKHPPAPQPPPTTPPAGRQPPPPDQATSRENNTIKRASRAIRQRTRRKSVQSVSWCTFDGGRPSTSSHPGLEEVLLLLAH